MEGHAVIAHDVLAAYAADAACEVEGVKTLIGGPRRHRGVRVSDDGGALCVEVHLILEWGAVGSEVGPAVQVRVAEYLRRMAKLPSVTVDVVFGGVGSSATG